MLQNVASGYPLSSETDKKHRMLWQAIAVGKCFDQYYSSHFHSAQHKERRHKEKLCTRTWNLHNCWLHTPTSAVWWCFTNAFAECLLFDVAMGYAPMCRRSSVVVTHLHTTTTNESDSLCADAEAANAKREKLKIPNSTEAHTFTQCRRFLCNATTTTTMLMLGDAYVLYHCGVPDTRMNGGRSREKGKINIFFLHNLFRYLQWFSLPSENTILIQAASVRNRQ